MGLLVYLFETGKILKSPNGAWFCNTVIKVSTLVPSLAPPVGLNRVTTKCSSISGSVSSMAVICKVCKRKQMYKVKLLHRQWQWIFETESRQMPTSLYYIGTVLHITHNKMAEFWTVTFETMKSHFHIKIEKPVFEWSTMQILTYSVFLYILFANLSILLCTFP